MVARGYRGAISYRDSMSFWSEAGREEGGRRRNVSWKMLLMAAKCLSGAGLLMADFILFVC